MDKTLLDLAKADYTSANILFNSQYSNDECILNITAYHLQQSVEKCLKYQLEQAGVEYPKIHTIEQLITLMKKSEKELNISFSIPEYVDEHAEMLTTWESKTRYILDYSVEKRKIETAFPQIKSLIDISSAFLEKEISVQNNDRIRAKQELIDAFSGNLTAKKSGNHINLQ